MLAERTKLLNQERRKAAANVQSVTEKMNRLTNRKSSLQKPYLVNEYTSSDKGEKVVTFNNNSNAKNSNHSTSKNTSTSSEGKKKKNTTNATLLKKYVIIYQLS